MTVEEEDKKREIKGFAGISSLVSDVDMTPPHATKIEPVAAAPGSVRPAPQPAQPVPSQQHQTRQDSVQPASSGRFSAGMWLLGIISVVGLIIWLSTQFSKNTNLLSSKNSSAIKINKNSQGNGSIKSKESVAPKFNDYLSEIYIGQRTNAKLLTDFDNKYKTRIRRTNSQPINFAGEYVLSAWGCGMDCLMGVAVNTRTGQIIKFPGFVCCWKGGGESVIFRKNSRLLVLAGLINEYGQHGAHFYEFKDNKFIYIQTIPVKENEFEKIPSNSESTVIAPKFSLSLPIETLTKSQFLTQSNKPSMPIEEKPPVGKILEFSTAQIRYCVAEKIRMEGANSVLDNYSDPDVDRFNAMVADYNSRCVSFRYRSGELESVRRDIESYRSQFQSEGRSRFFRSPSTGSLSSPTPATSLAIVPPTYTPSAHASLRQESASPTRGSISQNAHLNYLGNGWECNRSYYRSTNECLPVQIPRYATIDIYG